MEQGNILVTLGGIPLLYGEEKNMELLLRHLGKAYRAVRALSDMTAEFAPGVHGILGPNGAGKSTLMNLIADVIPRSEGEILFNGVDILSLGAKFRDGLGYMPQQQGLYDEMTVESFLFYMAELKGLSRRNAAAQIGELLTLTDLAQVRRRRVGGFSGGMRQRTLLCQALLGSPRVLLLDEPTAGLDPRERIRIRNYISTLARDRIVLMTTHIVGDVEPIADRILLMEGGRALASGSPAELMDGLRGKVGEMEYETGLAGDFRLGALTRRQGRTYVRVVGETLPREAVPLEMERLSLEDVYLFYFGERYDGG